MLHLHAPQHRHKKTLQRCNVYCGMPCPKNTSSPVKHQRRARLYPRTRTWPNMFFFFNVCSCTRRNCSIFAISPHIITVTQESVATAPAAHVTSVRHRFLLHYHCCSWIHVIRGFWHCKTTPFLSNGRVDKMILMPPMGLRGLAQHIFF